MQPVELPLLRAGGWHGVTVERAELAGSAVFVTTVAPEGMVAKRRWFTSREEAMAFGAERADAHGAALFDLDAGEACD